MKVVLFCGGLGTRIRDYSEAVPKPMIQIGYRPILWHVMKYYAHFGHKDFILCLGYKADVIKRYFLEYEECLSNDFVLVGGQRKIELEARDIEDWRITFVDTGLLSNLGQRLKTVENHLVGEEYFLANYTDGLSDVHLPSIIESFRESEKIGSFVSVRPKASFHLVQADKSGAVQGIEHIGKSQLRMNGGFFVFRKDIFSYLNDGEDLVDQPFQRLITKRALMTYPHDGFWACMDSFKDKQELEDAYGQGIAPWQVWLSDQSASEEVSVA